MDKSTICVDSGFVKPSGVGGEGRPQGLDAHSGPDIAITNATRI